MKISIITVAYNAEKHIETVLQSVLSQKFDDYEYLVIDGGSKDSTLSIVRAYEEKFSGKMRYLSEPDNGIYDAMNKGVRMAQGEYIHILNSDDQYIKADSLALASAKLVQGLDLLSTSVQYIMPKKIHILKMQGPDKWQTIPHPGLFVRRNVYLKNPFDLAYRYAADIDLFLRLQDKCSLEVDDEIAVRMLAGGAGSSVACIKETIRIFLNNKMHINAIALVRPLIQKYVMNGLKGHK